MAFRLEEFKKTTRKSAGGSVPAAVYPHQIKDKKALARLEIAIRLFDGSVGKRRGDLDAQAMTDFFGEPRLARGIVACLGQFYKYETPDFRQIVGHPAEACLREAGLARPIDVRAYTYARVNEEHGGFLTEANRAACYAALGERFCLTAHQWNTLLHLDAEDNQTLTRINTVPTPADIVAVYNFHSLDTPLRRATQIVLAGLPLSDGEATDVRALARALGVKAVVSGETVTLTDLPSPLSGELFPRRIGRLSRCALFLVQAYATRSTTGYADALLGTRKFRLMLGTDALRALGMLAKPSLEKPAFRRRFEAAQTLHKDLLKRRTRGEGNGWRIKRLPDPVVTAQGVLLPDFKLMREGQAAYVLLMSSSLAPPLLGVGGTFGDVPVLSFSLSRKPLDAAAVLARADGAADSLFALPARPQPAVPGDVLALCDQAVQNGMVRAADARRVLHLLDDSPLIEWVRQCADPRVRYIPASVFVPRSLSPPSRAMPLSPSPSEVRSRRSALNPRLAPHEICQKVNDVRQRQDAGVEAQVVILRVIPVPSDHLSDIFPARLVRLDDHLSRLRFRFRLAGFHQTPDAKVQRGMKVDVHHSRMRVQHMGCKTPDNHAVFLGRDFFHHLGLRRE